MPLHRSPAPSQDEIHLGVLAMRFRRTKDEPTRAAIAEEYAATVDRLIRAGGWDEYPAPENTLPDERMPPAFRAYWSRGQAVQGQPMIVAQGS